MTYGPNPWQQLHWDWRAAANFIGGGAGGGLIVFTALAGSEGGARTLLLLVGLGLIGLGLACVWLEIGRPLRAMNVFRHPHRSWMTREALVAALLFPAGLAAAFGVPFTLPLAGVLAAAFVWCQARILRAAKGIPAWREPKLTPMLLNTALVEGGGLFWALRAWDQRGPWWLWALLVAGIVARVLLWRGWRHALAARVSRPAIAAVDRPATWLLVLGTLLPLALMLAAASGPAAHPAWPAVLALAGLCTAVAGSLFKFMLVTRAAFNQGFAIPHLPVRGVPRA